MFQTTTLIPHPSPPMADMTECSLRSGPTALCDTQMVLAVTHLPCRLLLCRRHAPGSSSLSGCECSVLSDSSSLRYREQQPKS